MSAQVALCIDEVTAQNLETIGLEGEALDAQRWLSVLSSGEETRRWVNDNDGISELWIVSCDDVEPINLAASVKSDRPELRVCLVTFDPSGSLFSRALNASIDEVMEQAGFLRRYAETKRVLSGEPDSSKLAYRLPKAEASILLPASAADPKGLAQDEEEAPRLARFTQWQLQIRGQSARAANRAFVLSVVSGSGGTGKSTVSALGSLIARNRGYRTLLLDYDLQFGDTASMIGTSNPLGIDTALAHPEQLERELARDENFLALASPARLEAAEEIVQALPILLEQLAALFDVVVVNTGAVWAEQHAALIERSSAALFLVDQRVSSVRSCKHALELCARCGIASGPFQFALNRCSKAAPLTSIDVSCALQGAPVFELKEGGRDVEDYLSSGAADELIETGNDFVQSLEYVMMRILPGGNHQATAHPNAASQQHGSPKRRGRHTNRRRSRRQP